MKKGTYFRLLALCLLVAALLSGISLLSLSRLADYAAARHRGDFLMFVAGNIEKSTAKMSLEDLKTIEGQALLEQNLPSRPPPFGPPGGFPPPPPPPPFSFSSPPPGGPHSDFWLVAEDSEVIYSSRPNLPLPQDWSKLPRSQVAHQIESLQDFFRLNPGLFIIRLEKSPAIYLVVRENRNPFSSGPLLVTQAFLTFATVLAALFFAMTLVFFYLRKKSQEARAVLYKMEQGDLKARFEIRPFDQFGGLLIDFNRMAGEIERLVSRVRETETARKNLLQELGHDLRTPLTSLKTSFETLKFHLPQMTEAERDDLFEMIEAEVAYFAELLESLMTMAGLDEPHYKASTAWVDLDLMVRQEVAVRQSASTSKLKWSLLSDFPPEHPPLVMGDAHLLLRFFKNAFDNAAKFARTKVDVQILQTDSRIELRISDDGSGLSREGLASFGHRRDQRTRRAGGGLNFSLGLGSVIMKTIVELHGGTLEMKNGPNGGAELGVTFSLSQNKTNS